MHRREAFSGSLVSNWLTETIRFFHETIIAPDGESLASFLIMTAFRNIRRGFVWQNHETWLENWIAFGPDGVFRKVRLT